MAVNAQQVAGGKKMKHAWLALIWGVVLVVLFVWGLMLQIQTSEGMLLNDRSTVTLSFSNIDVLAQIPNMLQGQYTLGFAMAVFLAYSIEAGYFLAIVFFEIARNAVGHSGALMERVFIGGILLCVAYNLISDYSLGTLGSGWLGHLAFSLLVTFVESFFGIVGVDLIMKGWKMA